jgi:hypothetical protein
MESVRLQAKPTYPYTFSHWHISYNDGTPSRDSTGSIVNLAMVKDMFYTAHFDHDPYTPSQYELVINAIPYHGGTTSPPVGRRNYDAGTLVTISASPNSGYFFTKWSVDGQVSGNTAPSITVKMDSGHYVNAHFEEHAPVENRRLTIQNPSGRGTTSPATGTYTYTDGATAMVWAFPDNNNQFQHWKLDGILADTISPIRIIMDKDYTLQGVFTNNDPNPPDPSPPIEDEPTDTPDPPYTPPAPTKYSLSLGVSPSGAGSTNPQSGIGHVYDDGTSVTITISNVNSGYEFREWRIDGSSVGKGSGSQHSYTVNMNMNHEVLALFNQVSQDTKHTLNIYVSPAGAGSVTPYGIGAHQVDAGKTITLSASAGSDYKFDKWYKGSVTETSTTLTFTMDKDYDIAAYFDPDIISDETYDGTILIIDWPTESVTAGQHFSFSAQVKNLGTAIWSTDTVGIDVEESIWNTERIELLSPVGPSDTYSKTVSLAAPTTAGTYTATFQLEHDVEGKFGTEVSKQITVADPDDEDTWVGYTGWFDWFDLDYDPDLPTELSGEMIIPTCAKYQITDWGVIEKTASGVYKIDVEVDELLSNQGFATVECTETHTYNFATAPPNKFAVEVYSDGVYLGQFVFDNGDKEKDKDEHLIDRWPFWFIVLLLVIAIICFIIGIIQLMARRNKKIYSKTITTSRK